MTVELPVRRARDSAGVREMLALLAQLERHRDRQGEKPAVPLQRQRAYAPREDDGVYAQGTHPLGDHVWIVIRSARQCRPATHTADQARALLEAVCQCLDLTSTVPAARPRAASAEREPVGNRTRSSLQAPAPMNPVHRMHATGKSAAPGSVRVLDSARWRHEWARVDDHADRCEVVRRSATYLAGLLAVVRVCPHCGAAVAVNLWVANHCPECAHRSPPPSRAVEDEKQLRQRIAVEAEGHALRAAAERFDRRSVVQARIEAGQHPVRGVAWTPPDDNATAAREARAMRDEGLTTVQIAAALQRNANTVRSWTTRARRAAA